MVAVIKTGHSVNRILNYNENKVKEGVAEIIAAINFPMDAEQLSFTNKLNRLKNQCSLNENVTRNSVHVSLNFDPSEHLGKEELQGIAATYMKGIGFGEQPYLVYKHLDAGHPHIHIVSVKVRADGSRIDMQNIGRIQSEKARREIEQSFGLKRAEDSKQQRQQQILQPINLQKVHYGKVDTKRAITNVLDRVIDTYRYTSLPELNAVLRQYNVMADSGSEGSRVFSNHGLVYRVVDAEGNKVGVPIKASDFYSKPTLNYLEAKFAPNEVARNAHKARVKNAIDLAFLRHKVQALPGLVAVLAKEGIATVIRVNDDGLVYGITYVDHRTKCVFNGSALGKQYSAKGMLERCSVEQARIAATAHQASSPTKHFGEGSDLLETLMQPEYASGFVPYQLTKKGKKKKKRRTSKDL